MLLAASTVAVVAVVVGVVIALLVLAYVVRSAGPGRRGPQGPPARPVAEEGLAHVSQARRVRPAGVHRVHRDVRPGEMARPLLGQRDLGALRARMPQRESSMVRSGREVVPFGVWGAKTPDRHPE